MAASAEKRGELAAKAADFLLEFLLRYLPNVAVPPVEGVKDNVGYKIDGVDLSGFVIKKESVEIEIGGLASGDGTSGSSAPSTKTK